MVAGSEYKHAHTKTRLLTCHSVTVGRAIGMIVSLLPPLKESLNKSLRRNLGWEVSISTWRWAEAEQKTTNVSFRISALLSYVKGLGTYHSLKMEVVAWDQSAHLLFVQLFFPRVLRSGREKGALKALYKCLNSRCDGRSRNKQIGNWTRVRALKLKLGLAECRQKLALCVWMMTSDHPQSNWAGPTTYVAYRHTLLYQSARLDWTSLTSKLIKLFLVPFPGVHTWDTIPQVMLVFWRSETYKYIRAVSTSYLGYTGCPEKNKTKFIDRGGKIMFVKSVSRGDECKAISPLKAIHHSLRRQSRGKVWEVRQTWAIERD